MKRKVHKKFAWVLIVCMLITLVPETALAAGLPAPAGLRLGVEKIIDQYGHEVMYSNTFTRLGLHWDEVASMEENGYNYSIETPMTVSGSGIVITGETSGGGVCPHVCLFDWFTLNGESIDYTVDKIIMVFEDDENENPGPSTTLNTDVTVRQVEKSQRLTASYTGSETETYGDYTTEIAKFKLGGVPASHSVDFVYRGANGNGSGSQLSSSENGFVEIKDYSYDGAKRWQYGLGDMEVDAGSQFFLDVYSTDLVSDTKASVTITRYPVDIVFDSFEIMVGGPLIYTGSQIMPGITVKTVEETPKILTKDVDYTLSFEKNGTAINTNQIVNAGTYTAVIQGKAGTAYEGKTARKTFTVAKATPDAGSYTVPTGLTAAYGQTLSDVALGSGFSWADLASTPVGNAGTNDFKVKYTPSDTENYNEVSDISVSITVSKVDQTPVLTLSSETGIVGLTPPAFTLTGCGGTGALHYVSSNPDAAAVDEATGDITIVAAGTTTFTVSKDGDTNYNASGESAGVVLTVKNKTNLTVKDTAATDATIATGLKNQGKINVGASVRTGLTNNFTIAVNGKASLTTYSSGDTGQVEGKWFGLLIGNLKVNDNSAYPTINMFYKIAADTSYVQFTPADENKSQQVGGTEKEFVYWIRSDVDPTKTIWLATSESGENETKLTVNFTPYAESPHHSGGSGGGSSSKDTPAALTPAAPKTSTEKGTATVSATVTATTNTNGTASATVPVETMSGLIEKAKAAEDQNKNAVIEIKVKADTNAKAAEVTIEKSAFNKMIKETNAEVKVETGMGSILFDEKALKTINDKASGDISIRMETVDSGNLSEETKALVGDRPVYDLSVSAGDTKISSFNGGTASISIPYTLKSGEDKNAVVVYYVDDIGNLQTVRGAYNETTGMVDFDVMHFSKYAVGYNKVSFADVNGNAWYSDAVTFLSARGITTGTSANRFGPDAAITRGEFLVMLMRAYDIEPMTSSDNFADAGNSYYTNYLAAAKKIKITKGVGDNLYQPNERISRQDMFTLLYRALDSINEIPADENVGDINQFSDSKLLMEYAKTAVEVLVSSGVVSGSGGKLDPAGLSTRAQMAQLLTNLLSK